MSLNSIPKLAEMIADPDKVADLPPEAVPSMLGELERLRALLWARLVMRPDGNEAGLLEAVAKPVFSNRQIPS